MTAEKQKLRKLRLSVILQIFRFRQLKVKVPAKSVLTSQQALRQLKIITKVTFQENMIIERQKLRKLLLSVILQDLNFRQL